MDQTACKVTQSINSANISRRICEMALKPEETRLSKVKNPLTQYSEFRGLLFADSREALKKCIPAENIDQIYSEQLD
jgi:hypothetical protein